MLQIYPVRRLGQLSLSLQYVIWSLLALLGAGVIALGAVALKMSRRLRRLEGRQRELLAGTDGGNLEQILSQHLTHLQAAVAGMEELRARTGALEVQAGLAIQHIGVVRFNAFADVGGDTSFALALADAEGNGCTLYSLHGRGEMRLYAKPLQGWASPYALADEEVEAIRRAQAAEAPNPK